MVGIGYFGCVQVYCVVDVVYVGVVIVEYYYLFVFQVWQGDLVFLVGNGLVMCVVVIDNVVVLYQEWQCWQYVFEVLFEQVIIGVVVGIGVDEYCVIFSQQLIYVDVVVDFYVQLELYVYVFQYVVVVVDYCFVQFEIGDVELQQFVDLFIVVVYYGLYVGMGQFVGIGQVGWVGIDYCYVFVGGFYCVQVWVLVGGQGCVDDVFFYCVDGYCVEFFQCVVVFVQVVLWIYLVVYFWQWVGGMVQCGCFMDVVFLYQLQLLWDGVVDWVFLVVVWVVVVQVVVGLELGVFFVKFVVQFILVVGGVQFYWNVLWYGLGQVEELEGVFVVYGVFGCLVEIVGQSLVLWGIM